MHHKCVIKLGTCLGHGFPWLALGKSIDSYSNPSEILIPENQTLDLQMHNCLVTLVDNYDLDHDKSEAILKEHFGSWFGQEWKQWILLICVPNILR